MMVAKSNLSKGERPDVILVIADQWRGQDQGWAGNPDVLTPRIDALAEGGVAIATAVANHPVCGPSRADLLTGRMPHEHHVVANDLPLADDVPTLAHAMRDAGYRTGWIGKWHLDGPPRDRGVRPGRCGFEFFAAVNCSHRYLGGHYYVGDDLKRVTFTGYEPVVQTDLALQVLGEQAPEDGPVFLVVSYGPPHDPYDQVPHEYLRRYQPERLTLRRNTADCPGQRLRQAGYYAGITAVDEQLGRIVDDLERQQRLERTLIIVLADHGDMLGSHGLRAKQVPFAEAVRVPLVMHWPEGLQPRRIEQGYFGLVDLAPTILDLVGAGPLATSYGLSMAAAVRGSGSLRQYALLGNVVTFDEGWRQGVPEWRGFVGERITYARAVDGTRWLLFDNHNDPWQQRNLVDLPIWRRTRDEADHILDRLLAESGDAAQDGEATLRDLNLVTLWNERELALHGSSARLLTQTPTAPIEYL